jgi:putative ABC transport system substrate-binding protein
MKTRRQLLVALGAGAIATPLACLAQQPTRVPRIGFLGAASASGFSSQIAGLRAGLRELGYIEGKTITLESRWAEGKVERLPELAKELVDLKIDVLVTQGVPATRAAKQATTTIPIVMAAVGDAVVMGLVASLARPGRNITGSTFFALELSAKRLELLKDAAPDARRVAVLFNPDNPIQRGPVIDAMESAAGLLKLELQPYEARAPNEFESAFSEMVKARVDAVVLIEEPMQIVNAKVLSDLATRSRLPSIGPLEFAPAGSLMAFGVNFPALYHRAAFFVDKILKGARPADLPIERATKFELIINMKTAKALGLTIPQSILLRADKVIE